MSDVLLRELKRKTFHMLTLVYWVAYLLLGHPRILPWMGGFALLVAAGEYARLRWSAFNRLLLAPFGGIIREEEKEGRMSGAYYTSLGSFLSMLLFGASPVVIAAAHACLAFGDAAAAVVGRAFGRHPWPGSRKSIEGSAACALACFAACLAMGVPWAPAALASLATAAVEASPAPYDDNLWIPLVSGAAVWLVLPSA